MTYRIGELSKLTGYSVESIRHYEKMGLLKTPPRTESGQRVYSENHLEILYAIKTFREITFGLQDISELIKSAQNGNFCENLQDLHGKYALLISEKKKELEANEKALMQVMLACVECPSKTNCLTKNCPLLKNRH
ncbi:MAG: transcriptional regulator [Micavibrio aeruginosavorus]|uniref:Transcriptional regulator n=1 Tax=Micavibrio aeruginosavorus TaxID=349221 RepID=A0A2W5BUR6_9BACT|nr:MAG: transcriptional regulator [Micavibrio aeruginosavorus]